MCSKQLRTLLIVAGILLFGNESFAQLSGSYTIGSGGDYTSIGDAVVAINSQGLTGDVTLHIGAGTYEEEVDLSNLNNGAFTVTLEGEDLENTSISPAFDMSPVIGINIEDTDHITIRNLTIRMPFESGGSQTGVYIDDASNISIENNIVFSLTGIAIIDGNNVKAIGNIVVAEDVALGVRNCNTLDVIHNTLHSEQIGSRNFKASGDYTVLTQAVVVFEGVLQNVKVINNIFSGVEPQDPDGTTGISFGSDFDLTSNLSIANLTSDFNLFDTNLGMAVHGVSSNTTANGTVTFGDFLLTEWSNLINQDLNSESFNPEFQDGTDFRIDTEDFRFGTFLADYSTDIDGETRFEGAVDVGADQFCVSIEATESVESCESFEFAGSTLTESGEYFGEFVATNGCDSLVTLQLTILEPTAGSDDLTAEGSYNWNGIIYSESGTYEQILTGQNGCDSVATLNLTIEPYFLEGNFVIGSSGEANFSNFTEAIADLQHATLTGDVEYFLESGTYNDTLKISTINNGDYSITFHGEDKATTILHPLDSIDESGSGILIDGTNNVTIQNLTLEMDDISDVQVSLSSNDTKGISIVNSDNITLDNLSLRNDSEVSDYSSSQFFISSAVSITNVNELTVSSSSFSGSGSHITLGDHSDVAILENTFETASEIVRNDPAAGDDPTGSNLRIEGNEFSGPFDSGIELSLVEDMVIRSNVLDGLDANESGFAISSSENTDLTIEDNTIKNVEFGIDLGRDTVVMVVLNRVTTTSSEAFYADRSAELKVVNNFFGDVVLLRRLFNFDFIHNTVVSASSDGRDEVLYFEVDDDATGDLTARINNNIIVGNNQVSDWLVNLFTANANLDFSLDLTMDHNLYYLDDDTGLKPLVNYEDNTGDTQYGTLADWQTAQPYDQNSHSFNPVFVDTNDFHISSASDYRFGTFINEVTTDIDGDNRIESIGVDVGADQFCVTYDESVDIAVCESYTFDGTELTNSGQYQASFLSTQSCDSLVTLNLTILEPSASEETIEACNSYEWNGTTYMASGTYQELFTNAVGCDSTAVLNLTINQSTQSITDQVACDSYEWNGTTYTASGTYEELFTNAVGCDSTAVLNLTINQSTESVTDLVACDSYEWNGTTYTASGFYEELFTNAAGCDSTAVLNLTINQSTESASEEVACDSYEWNGTTYMASGTYEELFTNAVGCDSTAVLNLTILESDEITVTEEACGSYFFDGADITSSGTYTATFSNDVGCDSLVTLNLSILDVNEIDVSLEECVSYSFGSQLITESGTYSELFTNEAGCDSLVNLSIGILAGDEVEETLDHCGDYLFGSLLLTESGTYTESFQNQAGCDSTVTLTFGHLTEPTVELAQDGALLTASAQEDVTFEWYDCDTGEVYTTSVLQSIIPIRSGNYAVEVTNGAGCVTRSNCVFFDWVLATSDRLTKEASIYPTITKGNFMLDLKSEYQDVEIVISAMNGRVIFQKKYERLASTSFDLAQESEGIYIVQTRLQGQAVNTQRIVKR